MSARQIRRLEQLEAAATTTDLLDGELSESSSSSASAQPTGFVASRQGQRKKQKKAAKKRKDDDDDICAVPLSDTGTSVALDRASKKSGPKKEPQERKPKKSTQKQPKQHRSTSVIPDDDAEFEALLEKTVEQTKSKERKGGKTVHRDPQQPTAVDTIFGVCSPSLLSLLTVDANALDPRTERIRNFGAKAVEDIKPKRPECPKFRRSAFATPDPNTWAPYDALGLRLEKVSPSGTAEYHIVGETSKEYSAAQSRFEAVANSAAGNWQVLVDVWRRQPYHLPTTLQLSYTFAVMGDVPQSQTMIDMALFGVGMLLATFPIGAAPTTRRLPYRVPSNRIVFRTLFMGVHAALRKGCAKTALELCKLLLSLDESDPMHVMLFMDYMALRSSSFDFLARLHDAATVACCDFFLVHPSLHFNSALARFLDATSDGEGERKKSGDELAAADAALCSAIRLFPNAAGSVADRAGETMSDEPWSLVGKRVQAAAAALEKRRKSERESQSDAAAAADAQHLALYAAGLNHVTQMFGKRSSDVWKNQRVMRWLVKMVQATVDEERTLGRADDNVDAARDPWEAAAAQRELLVATGQLERYRAATDDDVMGTVTQGAIPQELMQQFQGEDDDAQWGGDRQDAAIERYLQMMEEQNAVGPEGASAQALRDELERLHAIFGDLPNQATLSLEERLTQYRSLLQEQYGQHLGEGENPVVAFLQTMLPWNDTRQRAIKKALIDLGIEDPVEARQKREKAEARARANEQDIEFVKAESGDDNDDG